MEVFNGISSCCSDAIQLRIRGWLGGDKILLDEQRQQTDMYISHSGVHWFAPRRGRRGRYMIIGKHGMVPFGLVST